MGTEDENRYLLNAIDSIDKWLVVVSPGYEILAANAAAQRIQEGGITGHSCYRVLYGRTAPCEACGAPSVFEKGDPAFRQRLHLIPEKNPDSHFYFLPVFSGKKIEAVVCSTLTVPGSEDMQKRIDIVNSFLMNLILTASDGVIAAGKRGRIKLFNKKAAAIFGYPPGTNLAGMDIRNFYPGEGAKEVMAQLRSDQWGGKGKLLGYRLDGRRKDGSAVPLRLNAAIIYDGKRELATIGFFQDRREAADPAPVSAGHPGEAAVASEVASLGELISRMAHQMDGYNVRFGEAALQLGMITREQLGRALAAQKEMTEKSKMPIPIGRVMVRLGYLTEVQRDQVLAFQTAQPEGEKEKPDVNPPDAGAAEDSADRAGRESGDGSAAASPSPIKARGAGDRKMPAEQTTAESAPADSAETASSEDAIVETPASPKAPCGAAVANDAAETGRSAPAEAIPDAVIDRAESKAPVAAAGDNAAAVPADATTGEAAAAPPLRETVPDATGGEDDRGAAPIGAADEEGTDAEVSAGETPEQKSGDGEAEGETGAGAVPKATDKIGLTVSPDRLQACIDVAAEHVRAVTPEMVNEALAAAGVVFGVVEALFIRAYLDADPRPETPFVVAQGKAAEPGTPATVRYNFDTDPQRIGEVREDGSIDWKNRGMIPQAVPDQALAEIVPGREGEPGQDVFGEIIPIPLPEETLPSCGSGVMLSADGNRYVAKIAGGIALSTDRELTVFPVLNIPGDVGIDTGHVAFGGHVDVSGLVKQGYRVKAHSLKARGVESATIDLAGDLTVFGGIYESTVACGGNMKVSHIHDSKVAVRGDLVAEKEIFDSEIETSGKCVINRGTIVSSRIWSRMGIVAQHIGTDASAPGEMNVGVDRRAQKEMYAIRREINTLTAEIKQLEKKDKALRKRSDEISERLGDIAQEQDRFMVQQRRLEKVLEDKGDSLDEARREKMANTIGELGAKRAEIDGQVESLLEADEQMTESIAQVADQSAALQQQIDALNKKLETLAESVAEDKGNPEVQVSGSIIAGTSVKGYHASLNLDEKLSRVRITETREPDEEGRVRWLMKVSPLR